MKKLHPPPKKKSHPLLSQQPLSKLRSCQSLTPLLGGMVIRRGGYLMMTLDYKWGGGQEPGKK